MRNLADKFRKVIYPILLKVIPSKITVPVEALNDMPKVQGNKLFAINHSCVLDGPVAGWVIKEHFYYTDGFRILSGVLLCQIRRAALHR